MIKEREKAIIQYILMNQHTTITKIAKHMNLSNKTVSHSLKLIDELFSGTTFELIRKPRVGVSINGDPNEVLSELNTTTMVTVPASKKERIQFLCFELLKKDLFHSPAFLMLYVTITSYFDIHGPQVFLPQSIGMFVGGMILSMKQIRQLKVNAIARNIITGSSWVIANTTLFVVSASLGVGITYAFSQMSLLVATYGSMILLRERKTSLEKRAIYLGTLVYVVGVVGMSLLK